MYRKHKIISFIIFFVGGIAVFLFNPQEMNSTILTSVSIIFGFNLTAFISMNGNKEFILKMKGEIDKATKIQQTKLQTINCYFKFSFYSCIINIIAIVVSYLFQPLNIGMLNRILTALVVSSFLVEIYMVFLILFLLMKSYQNSK